jgi:sugar/nucleoside kinase (ribokinase family)
VLVCTLGDLLLDVIVRLDAPLAQGDDATATTTLAPGGQAANVAAWAAELGADARVIAVHAEDDAGAILRRELERRGVELCGPPGARTGVVVSIVHPDGERTMASDRGSSPELATESLDARWLSCDALHISGYSLLEGRTAGAAVLAREHEARVSVDLSSWTQIEPRAGELRAAIAVIRPDVVFGNEREWDAIGDVETGVRVVKRGARGIVVGDELHDAVPVHVVDSTGAGDALAAGFIVGGAQLALEAAARCVAQVGAMP